MAFLSMESRIIWESRALEISHVQNQNIWELLTVQAKQGGYYENLKDGC